LAVQIGVAPMPFTLPCALQAEDLIREFVTPFVECTDGSIRGCWAITEPDHGSDTLMPGYPSFRDPAVRAQCRARLDGDEWVINGQKAAWVSGAPIATHSILFCQTDPSMGHAGGGIAFVPLDRPGVTKGKPLNKLGQRDMPQGEIFFEDARIPASYMLIREEAYEATLDGWLAGTTAGMGIASTGLARAAFEEALAYAKERVQGGKRLIEHPTVQTKLFRMFEKVEAMRQMSRAASVYNNTSATPAIEYGIAAKLNGTEGCFEVASDAVQIFGGNGLAKEYLVEKLFRDARATLIEDGSNDILAIAGGHKVIETYPRI
jgi:alkylation response protein AidB-like acyl-CoA dehydrogenase